MENLQTITSSSGQNKYFPIKSQSIVNKDRLEEFLQWFNSVYRLTLLNGDQTNKEEQIYLLLLLKRSIKYAITEISHKVGPYSFKCSECDQVITSDTGEDFWAVIQSHEHFEALLSGQQATKPLGFDLDLFLNRIHSKITDSDSPGNLTVDSDIQQLTHQLSTTSLNSVISNDLETESSNEAAATIEEICADEEPDSDTDSSDSNFQFQFEIKYDDIVEEALYTPSIIRDVRKIDKIKDYTIQFPSKRLAVCLLCSCDLVHLKSVSKKAIYAHVGGQRHLRFAQNPIQVLALSKYHETFLNLDTVYQCHQVYFVPDIGHMKCILCNSFTKYSDVKNHIDTDPHRTKMLTALERGTDYKLIAEQATIYSNPPEQVATKLLQLKEAKNKKKDRERVNSGAENLTHNIIKSVVDGGGENFLDMLPNRFKFHKKFLHLNANKVTCEPCKKFINKEIDAIVMHVRTNHHIEKARIKFRAYNYYCEVCNQKFGSELEWQKHHKEGPNKHNTGNKKHEEAEYECTTCWTIIYGDELSLTRHLSQPPKRAVKETKLPDKIVKLYSNKQSVSNLGDQLTHEANAVLEDRNLNMNCCRTIEKLLSGVFPGCIAYPFGSRISGLGNTNSDLDVFLDIGDMYNGDMLQDPQDQALFVKKAQKVLRRSKGEVKEVIAIATARTPIVRMYQVETQMDCDISFRHGLSVENTKFLRFCMQLQPITQTLILLVKHWAHNCEFSDLISTYALAMLVIFYMQTNHYLPSVAALRQLNKGPKQIIDGWETINYTVPIEAIKKKIVPFNGESTDILMDFFTYYSLFDYNTLVVCPLLGRTVLKKNFTLNGGLLPAEMKPYVVKLKYGGEAFRALSTCCVQDPFDMSHNLTKACQPGTVNKFKHFCDLSAQALKKCT